MYRLFGIWGFTELPDLNVVRDAKKVGLMISLVP